MLCGRKFVFSKARRKCLDVGDQLPHSTDRLVIERLGNFKIKIKPFQMRSGDSVTEWLR